MLLSHAQKLIKTVALMLMLLPLGKVEKAAGENFNKNTDLAVKEKLREDLKEVMTSHASYLSHLLRTKHQANYHKFLVSNMQLAIFSCSCQSGLQANLKIPGDPEFFNNLLPARLGNWQPGTEPQ